MLELRPNCECCDRDLPPDTELARICTFECTFCVDCADGAFGDRCPNCGGDLTRRPVRPVAMLAKHPASTERVLKPHPECEHAVGSQPSVLSPRSRHEPLTPAPRGADR